MIFQFFAFFLQKKFAGKEMLTIFAIPKQKNGVIAQLVEQRTENPCVPGSIPGDTTRKRELQKCGSLFYLPKSVFVVPIKH